VAALVARDEPAVDPDLRAIVDGAEVENCPLSGCSRRALECARVPDDVVEVRVPYARERRLDAERDDDRFRERPVALVERRCRDVLPAGSSADVGVVEREAPPAVEVDPAVAAQLGPRVFGPGKLLGGLVACGAGSRHRDGKKISEWKVE
jgi:hypothetical protein